MKAAKDDRRSRRTRQLLGNALVELMLERRYDTITVQDILDRADVGRSTFYTHYSDKEDLLISQIADVLRQLEIYTASLGHTDGGLLPSLEFFRHVREQRRLIHAFVWGQGGEYLMKEFQKQVSELVEQNLRTRVNDTNALAVPLPVMANFVASTLLMLLQWWFEHDLRQSPEEMDTIFHKLVMPSIQALLT